MSVTGVMGILDNPSGSPGRRLLYNQCKIYMHKLHQPSPITLREISCMATLSCMYHCLCSGVHSALCDDRVDDVIFIIVSLHFLIQSQETERTETHFVYTSTMRVTPSYLHSHLPKK